MCYLHKYFHSIFHFRSVHHLSFQVLFLFTNIQSLSISLYLIFRLSLRLLSLQPHSPSLFRHVHYPPLFLSRSLFSLALALSLQPRSPLYSLLLWTSPISFCFSLYLSLYFLCTQPIIICRTSLTTVLYISKISQK